MRFLGAVLATVLASSFGTLVACSGQDKDKEESVPTDQAVNGATVKIALMDANGTRVGDASGVLLTPRLVLTAGHAISGKYTWQVTSADGKQKVVGSRGLTYDWMTYDSQKAHPRRHDIGVIHLDAPIKLDAYPRLVGDKALDNMAATRIRSNGATFDKIGVTLKKEARSPNNWLAEIDPETLDTGGAVYDERGILGVVSGRGMATNKLYVARADQLASWINDKVACATPSSSVRTYAPPAEDKSKVLCDDAGNPLPPGTNTTSSSSGTSGTPTSSTPSNPGEPSDGSCKDNNDGYCSGAGCEGTGGSNPNQPHGDDDDDSAPSGPNAGGDDDDGTGGTNPTQPGQPGGDDDDDSTTNPNGTPGQSSGQSTKPGTGGTNGNKGDNSSSSGGTQTGSGKPSSSSGGAGSHKDSGEACQGANDNPEVCPPEPDGCTGAACGGGYPDELIDYGSCACGSTSTDDGKLHVR